MTQTDGLTIDRSRVAAVVRRARWLAVPVAVAVVTVTCLIAVTVGPADLTVGEVYASIGSHLGFGVGLDSATRDAIVWELRLPRVLTAALVGAGLAICGVVMQATLRNPLAEPYLLGLSAGASLGAVAVIVLGAAFSLPVAAFVGAGVALAATLLLAGPRVATSTSMVILAGVAVSAACSAATSLVIFWSSTGDNYREILAWLLGSLAGSTWSSVIIAAIAVAAVGTPLVLTGNLLDGFVFGDRAAQSFGIDAGRARLGLLGGSALLTGAMVSVSGSIGFIGLVVPHAVRLVVGHRHRPLLPFAAATGAVFLVVADTAARTAFEPRELPVGIITALIGAPLFAVLLIRSRRET